MTAETPRPARIVDAHVHLWDPARTDWYPYLTPSAEQADLDMGDVSAMARRFDMSDYAAEAGDWNVEKVVNVAAATDWFSVDETLELDRRADEGGGPDAIIGGLPSTESVSESIAALDTQLAASRFRGVRRMGADRDSLPADEVLDALAERGLIFEFMARPDQLTAAARGLRNHGNLLVVVEHTGWPCDDSEAEYRRWQQGLRAMADVGPNVMCKLSGLAMPLGTMNAGAFTPWLEYAIATFGVDRCCFASNFPVDGLRGTLQQLWQTYSTVTAGLPAEARDKLFAGNAERIYRC
ncbi:amidohydrolase family protein [Mycolicibacter heraklionensis]|uniref:Amidohydrolase family protein n=1 Tax=Mycolicibacter heraklionensis TaxID=512402 RepID=A0A9X7WLV6_9MYCO|nr:amidohydrolase family protein [Mycolicibacter heraklionensis]QZA09640.1 amidohydrolase family protein [Mycolicibacter heraklionensis]